MNRSLTTLMPPLTDTTLHIALLGPPKLIWDTQPVVLARRQVRALLYRLAVALQPVPRDHLCFLLWPDLPEAVARRNLTVLLTQLRHMLPFPEIVRTYDDAIALDPDYARADTATFAAAVSHAPRAGQLDLLASSADLYRAPFLDGFTLPASAEFDSWIAQERAVWERRYLDVLVALVDGYVALRDYQAAIRAAQRVLAVDELAEDMHRHLIELYAASGDRSAAMRQFERCAVILERELGVSPLPETRAVYAAVREGRVLLLERAIGGASVGQHDQRTRQAHEPVPLYRAPGIPTVPAPPARLIGRADELASASALLTGPDVRLLTLFGPGGSGKTRLAQQLAWDVRDQFADGAMFVALASLRDPALVLGAIAQACGLQESGLMPLADVIQAYLHEKQLLLILDNCEHLLAAAPVIAGLLAAAPGLRVLATSRSLLNLRGEHSMLVPPLPLPNLAHLPPVVQLAQEPAVALLLARTQALNPRFQLSEENAADVAAICVQLDGLPLAIELAAARLKLLAPRNLLRRLDRRLALLQHGPRDLPDRQQTLRATIDWSYRLLDVSEQRLFERLSVFAGGWTLEAAEAVCTAPTRSPDFNILNGLTALVDKSLVQHVDTGDNGTRFSMLETIREYAQERLHDRNEQETLQRSHVSYFCQFVERQAPRLRFAEILPALAELDADYDNVRAALGWSLEVGEHELAARIVSSLLEYWDARGLIGEGRAWNEQVMCLETAIVQPWWSRVRALTGYLAMRQGQYAEAAALAAAVIAHPRTDIEATVSATMLAGVVALEAGNLAKAQQYLERALTLAPDNGLIHDAETIQVNLGLLYLVQGNLAEAENVLRTSYAHAEPLQQVRRMGFIQAALGFIAVLRGEPAQAAPLLRDALHNLILVRETTFLLMGLLVCCGLAVLQQQPLRAVTLYAGTVRYAATVGLTLSPVLLTAVQMQIEQTRAHVSAGEFDRAQQHGQSLSLDEVIALAQSLVESPCSKT